MGPQRGTRKRIFNKVAKGAAKEPVDTCDGESGRSVQPKRGTRVPVVTTGQHHAQAGNPPTAPIKRESGLRREEVATRRVTVDYYTDLERGNLDRASGSLIEALMHGMQRRRRNAGTYTTHGRRTRRQERSAVRHTRFDLPSSASSKRGSMLCRTCAATQRHLDGHRHG